MVVAQAERDDGLRQQSWVDRLGETEAVVEGLVLLVGLVQASASLREWS